ncbi:FAS1-like dehydratase domain-containing protein [Actinoallomurus sp. CA-150999]|uniref:FAS1-like dehydratase domain-containing protein n=1 Tax=Actinoallomurus sp. CA-150999 TaxID=3239887 RepID=UPI003D8E3CCE
MSEQWQRAWQPMIDAVGTDFGDGELREGPEPVEAGAVRRFAEPLEFGCPLHHDRELARRYGYRDIPAPVSSLITFTIPPVWSPGDAPVFTSSERDAQPAWTGSGPVRAKLAPATRGGFATDLAIDHLKPVVVGDRLAVKGNVLVSCVPKQTSVGRGAFLTWESEIHDQRGELVARRRTTGYSYEPGPARPSAGSPAPSQDHQPRPDAEPQAGRPIAWDRQLWWDDLAEGRPLPAVRFPLTVYRLVMAAGSNRDFHAIHHNTEWARSTGAPEMYANVLFLHGMWERCVREFIGLGGEIRGFSGFRMRSFNTVGDVVTVRGEVARVWEEADTGVAELRLWSENRHGVSVGPGTVTVTLPRRPARQAR